MTIVAIALGVVVALLLLRLARRAIRLAALAALAGFGLFMAHQGGAF